MSINKEAVEAVAKALVEEGAYGVPWGDASDDDRADATSKARTLLEAAAPHIAAQALEDAADAFEGLPINKGDSISSGTSDWFELFPIEHIRYRAEVIRHTK